MNTDLKVISFNIRRSGVNDGNNSWEFRKGYVTEWLNQINVDILGLQEAMPDAVEYIKSKLPQYVILGCGRNEKLEDEHCCIAIKKERFIVIDEETFWLSDRPSIPGSKFTYSGNWERICTAVTLYDKYSGSRFRVYNTHLDNESDASRVSGIDIIYRKMGDKYKSDPLPIVLMGDFNDIPSSSLIKHVEKEAPVKLYNASDFSSCEINYTYHGYFKDGLCKIDYIYVTRELKFLGNAVADNCYSGVYLSDHFPVIADFDLELED